MKQNTIILIVALGLFSSCSMFKYSSRVAEIQTSNNTITTPSVVDAKIDFSKKISVKSDAQETENAAKENAYYKAVQENGIDVLISPIYEIITNPAAAGKAKVTATVTGYAGYFTNARTLTQEKEIAYNAKLDALGQMLKLEPIVKEEQKTVIIGSNVNVSNGSTVVSGSGPSLVEKFDMLYNGIKTPEAPTTVVSTLAPAAVIANVQPNITTQANPTYLPTKQMSSMKLKNPKLAGIMSLFVAGTGQFYNGQYLKGLLMMGIEVTAISMLINSENSYGTYDPYLNDYTYDYTGPLLGVGLLGANLLWSAFDAESNAKKINKKNQLSLNFKLDNNTDLALQPDFKLMDFGGKINPVLGAKLALNLY